MSIEVSIQIAGAGVHNASHQISVESESGAFDALAECIRRAQADTNKYLTEKMQEIGGGMGPHFNCTPILRCSAIPPLSARVWMKFSG